MGVELERTVENQGSNKPDHRDNYESAEKQHGNYKNESIDPVS